MEFCEQFNTLLKEAIALQKAQISITFVVIHYKRGIHVLLKLFIYFWRSQFFIFVVNHLYVFTLGYLLLILTNAFCANNSMMTAPNQLFPFFFLNNSESWFKCI